MEKQLETLDLRFTGSDEALPKEAIDLYGQPLAKRLSRYLPPPRVICSTAVSLLSSTG